MWRSCVDISKLSKNSQAAVVKVCLTQLQLLRDARTELSEVSSELYYTVDSGPLVLYCNHTHNLYMNNLVLMVDTVCRLEVGGLLYEWLKNNSLLFCSPFYSSQEKQVSTLHYMGHV